MATEKNQDRLQNIPFKGLHFKDFQRNELLGLGSPVVVVVKDQDRLTRHTRLIYAYSQKKKYHGRTTARDYLKGFVYQTELTSTLDLPEGRIYYKEFPEPRNISFAGNDILVTAANKVHIFKADTQQEMELDNQYFGNLHTSIPNDDNTRFIVTSTGFDSIVEFDQTTKKQTWRWTAWDHGYNVAANGSMVTENSQEAEKLRQAGHNVVLLDDNIKREGFGIPGAYRTTHVNEAIYDYDQNMVLATFFHKGILVRINRDTGLSDVVMSGMNNPHAIKKEDGGYIVTDTSNGAWFKLDNDFNIRLKVDFTEFPGKPENLTGIEWIQYVAPIGIGLYIAIDSNRQSAWVFNPKSQEYNQIPTNPEWSIQAILQLNDQDKINLSKWK